MGRDELETLRYGRARLTVARSGPLNEADRLGEALDAYEKGDVRPGSVALAYLRARVVDHSASFRWRGARLGELIPLVTSVADPPIEAETSRELADELVRLRRLEGAKEPKAEPRPKAKPAPPPDAPAPAELEAAPRPVAKRPARDAQARRRLFAILALGLAAVAVVAFVLTRIGGDDEELADDYRDSAGPAAKRVADSMDTVFDGFDLTIAGYEDEIPAKAIDDAHQTIDEERPLLVNTPGSPLAGGDTVDEIEAARAAAEEYLADSEAFLDDFEDYLRLSADEAEAEARAIYERTIDLAEQAEALEDAIFSLGTGTGDPDGRDHYRPLTPESLPKPG